MLKATFRLDGASPLFFGKHVQEKKTDKETAEQHEHRTWPKKVHVNDDGGLFIPPFALKNGLEAAAKWLNKKIPGEGKATFTKRFRCGVHVWDNITLSNGVSEKATMDCIEPLELFVPSDGVRGGGKRVTKVFPKLEQWGGTGAAIIFDEKITESIFEDSIVALGQYIGFGSMRVENGGSNGRFSVKELNFEEVTQ